MTLLWIAIAGCFVIAASAVAYAMQLNKRMQMLEQQSTTTIKQLQHELDVVNNAAMGVGQRLIQAEKKLKQVTAKQQQLELMSGDQLPYGLAASFAANGAAAEQLAERYGLPEAEANLLSLLKSRVGDTH